MLKTRDFEYHLPESSIAQTPIEPRDSSKLLVIDRSKREVSEQKFTDIVGYFEEGDLLVLNNTKVIAARLPALRPRGGKAEIFLLRNLGDNLWETLVKPGSRIPVQSKLTLGDGSKVDVVDRTEDGGRLIQFASREQVEDVMRDYGQVPLPPYIKEPITDVSRYQTIYASIEGSVAAPTAALHFTQTLLDAIKSKGVQIAYTTLHMGLGSFRPIKEEDLSSHVMPVEHVLVTEDVAEKVNLTKKAGKRVIACGTDVVRTLESAAAGEGRVRAFDGKTKLFITPGYTFKVVDRIITNLHLPRSSHLVLVSTFADRELIRQAYQFAVEKNFRFYTFGDATFMI